MSAFKSCQHVENSSFAFWTFLEIFIFRYARAFWDVSSLTKD